MPPATDTSLEKPAHGLVLTGNVLAGIGLKVTSVCVFVAMSTMIKSAQGIPPGQLVFYRSAFAILPILVFLIARRQLAVGFLTARPLSHLARSTVGVCAMGLSFFALTRLPLPEAIAIGYAAPLLIVVLSALVLKEHVRLYRWSAVLVGLVGVLIIIWPRITVFSGADADVATAVGALAALCAAALASVAMLLTRRLVATERSATIVLYFSLFSSIIALGTIPLGWVWPNPQQAALLVGAGIAGGLGQILLTESYRHADMSIIAPFEYTSILLGVLIGFLVFGEVPTLEMILGSAIVVGAGIFIILRESQLGLERAAARRVSTPQG